MAEDNPNRPRDEFGRDLGEKIRRNVQDEIHSRLDERRARWEAKQARRAARRAGGGGFPGFHTPSGGLLIGVILAGIGVILLLQNLDILPDRDLWEFWPVILIVAGGARAASACSFTGRMWGGLVAAGGVLFLLSTMGFIHRDMWNFFWPVVLIGAGAAMLFRTLERNHYLDQAPPPGGSPGTLGSAAQGAAGSADPRNANRIHEFAIFGGAHRKIDSQEFEGGHAEALFGGVVLDLRKANTKLTEVFIDITAAFGGVEIKVPENWAVSLRVTSIFGGYDDKTHAPAPGPVRPPVLVVTGATIFGGLNVRN